MSQTVNSRQAAKTKKLCDNCVLLMESSFSVKKLRTESGFKCENRGRRAGIGTVCEIKAKGTA